MSLRDWSDLEAWLEHVDLELQEWQRVWTEHLREITLAQAVT